jgi:ketosteroid isomerase-like protein
VWERFELAPDEFSETGGGENVLVLGTVRGRLLGSAEDIEARFAHVLQLEEGKVVRLKVCLDRESALRALGEQARS